VRTDFLAPAIALIFAAAGAAGAQDNSLEPEPYVKVTHPEWTKTAAIYEMNVRQMTEEGTFAAAQAHLPRLKELGVDILWLMPIHPIGETNRKGTLGSYYSVKDYYGVNPEFGTMEDFKAFVAAAHDQDMKVILDWVGNHTAWDNPLRDEHPDWYDTDWKGDNRPTPWFDWDDIIDLDYSQVGLREYMIDAMSYWVREADIDGYRLDTAPMVPIDFWEDAHAALDEIKDVYMLGEGEHRDMHELAFDTTYAWSWAGAMHDIGQGHGNAGSLIGYYSQNEAVWPDGAQRLMHVSNHDQNSWEGTQFERMGDALMPAIVLSVVSEGMPMIYSGQEAGNEKRLEFFEKDPIEWREHPIGDLYAKLFQLKEDTSALWNAPWGARMIHVPNDHGGEILSFVRQDDASKVFAAFNFSDEDLDVTFDQSLYHGSYTDFDSGETVDLDADTTMNMPAWSYRVLTWQG
jgi:glycosidase